MNYGCAIKSVLLMNIRRAIYDEMALFLLDL